MIALGAEDLADLRRWAVSGAIVIAAYGGVGAAIVTWQDPIDLEEPAAGIVIEFAPVTVAADQLEVQPGPEMEMSDPSIKKESLEEKEKEETEQKVEAKLDQKVENKVESPPVEKPLPEIPPAPNPEVMVPSPPPPQEVKQEAPQRQDPRPPATTTSAPRAISDQTASITAAPMQGPPNPNRLAVERQWNMQISAMVRRTVRYPPKAETRGQTGDVAIFFVLDRQGHVIESRILKPSGVALLDEEALAGLQRAQPFPPPPAEVLGERIERIVPIHFLPPGASSNAKR
jgi:protein TonB